MTDSAAYPMVFAGDDARELSDMVSFSRSAHLHYQSNTSFVYASASWM
jgi:hypothetical protein